jgi:hypothetical protein
VRFGRRRKAATSTSGDGPGRKRRVLLIPLAVLAVLALAIVAFAASPGQEAGFEDADGNLIVDSTFDWNGFTSNADPLSWQDSPATTPTRQAEATVNGFQFKGIEDWQATNSDSGFAGGTKQDNDCANVISAKAPNKDDLKRIYLASTTATVEREDEDGNPVEEEHTFLELAWVRIPQNTTSPSAHVAFEFNKGDNGSCNEPGGLVKRTAGDMLIVYDFEGGATDTPVITLRRWVTTGACEVGSSTAPCWGPATNLTALGFAEAKVNTAASVTDALAPPALNSSTGNAVSVSLGRNEFGEAGIDLTDAEVFEPGSCESFGTAFGVSRSSGNSGTAQMKDIVGPADFTLANCGEVNIIKHTDPRGLDQEFAYTSDLAGSELDCSQVGTEQDPETPTAFSLNDADNVDPDAEDSAANTQHCVNVPVGDYIVTEGADPDGFVFDSLSCEAEGEGSSGAQDGAIEKQANITVASGGVVTCTYVNKQELGAIRITKTRKHAAACADVPPEEECDANNQPHPDVTFTITTGTGENEVTVATPVTGSDGTACVDGLAFGDYTVTETVPDGYEADGLTAKPVTVDNNAGCDDGEYVGEDVAFSNTPLTDITINVDSQVDGGTASTIDCGDEDDPVSTDENGDGEKSKVDLPPGIYTCTVVVDP